MAKPPLQGSCRRDRIPHGITNTGRLIRPQRGGPLHGGGLRGFPALGSLNFQASTGHVLKRAVYRNAFPLYGVSGSPQSVPTSARSA